MTLQNEVKGLGQQTKTISEIYQEGEEAQKQWALRYVKTLKEFVKNKGNIWNKVLNIPSAQDPLHFTQMKMLNTST